MKRKKTLEKVERYRSKNGRLYETATAAMIDDFSGDRRMKRVAAYVGCGSRDTAWALWNNRESVRALLKDMESILDGQENQ